MKRVALQNAQLPFINHMKTGLALVVICFCVAAFSQNTNDERIVTGDGPSREAQAVMLATADATVRVNVVTARLNASRDVNEKKLRVYAVKFRPQTGVRKIEGFEVEMIFNDELWDPKNRFAIGYHNAYNRQVFAFAISQFAAGKKKLGLGLVKLIAEIDPSYWWSSPTHDPMMIKDIIAGLEKENESVTDLLKYESEGWAETVKNYGPDSNSGAIGGK